MATPLESLVSVTMQGTNCIGLARTEGTITGLYYSSDSGQNWYISNITTVSASNSNVAPIKMVGSNAIACTNTLTYYSSDYGHTWTASDLPSGTTTWSLSFDGVKALLGSTIYDNEGVLEGNLSYYSTNSGVNWTASTFSGLVPTTTYTSVFSVEIDASGNAVAHTSKGIYYSVNNGATFTKSTYPGSDTDADSLGGVMRSNYVVASLSEIGILYSTDYGQTFTNAYPANTYPVGSNLFSQSSSIEMDILGNCIISIPIQAELTYNILYSSNYGATWSVSTPGSYSFEGPGGSFAIGAALAISSGVAVSLSKYSSNNGATWSTSTPEIIPNVGAVSIVGSNVITSTGSNTYYSTDGGATYTIANLLSSGPGPDPIICFLEGSKILHLNAENKEEYVEIEKLKKGDLIKTVKNDYKKIEDIGYSKMYNNVNDIRSTDKLYKCSKDVYPELMEDLVITGAHSILVSNFKDEEQLEKTQDVLGKIYVTGMFYRLPACVDDRTTIHEIEGLHKIWHFSLENENYYSNYGVFANGLLVESCSKRMMKESGFHL
jgi:hypothetical protein